MAVPYASWFIAAGDANADPLEGVGEPVTFLYESTLQADSQVTFEWSKPPKGAANRTELLPGARLAFNWGYPGNFSAPFTCVVDEPGYNCDEGILRVVGRDLGMAMKKFARSRVWSELLYASVLDVANEIADTWGLDADVEGGLLDLSLLPGTDGKHEFDRHQNKESDWAYLDRLSRAIGWRFWIEGNTLLFRKDAKGPSVVRLIFGSGQTVKTFRPKFASATGIATNQGVQAVGYDPALRQVVEHTAQPRDKEFSRLSAGSLIYDRDTLRIIGRTAGKKLHVATSDAKEVEGRAVGTREDMLRKLQKAEMTVLGEPIYLAGTFVTVEGVDEIYAGTWRVAKASHRIDSAGGYTVRLDLDRETTGKVDAAQIGGIPITAQKPDAPAREEEDLVFNRDTLRRLK